MKPVELNLMIQSMQNCSWQGTVKSSDHELAFQSELELLFFIQKELEKRGAPRLAADMTRAKEEVET